MAGKLSNFPAERCKEIGQKIYDIAEAIENGELMSRACYDNEIDYRRFRDFLKTKLFEGKVSDGKVEPDDYVSWEDEVLSRITGGRDYIPVKDFKVAFEKVVSELPEREGKVIKMRFIDNYTLREVGEVFGVTGNRVREIESKALRRLRHPSRLRYLTYGDEIDIATREEEARKKLQDKAEEIETLRSVIAEKIAQHNELFDQLRVTEADIDKRINIMLEIQKEKEREVERINKRCAESIEFMELSVRAYNVLARARIQTVSQIAEMPASRLRDLRNMGVKTFDEITTVLKDKYGITLRE